MPSQKPKDRTIYTLFKEIFLLLDNGDRSFLQRFSLSVARFDLLSHLATHHELNPTDLCNLMLCDKANITRLLDGLEADGLVERQQDTTDGRRVIARLSPRGKKLWNQAFQAHTQYNRARLNAISPEDQEMLYRCLPQLKATLQESLEGN